MLVTLAQMKSYLGIPTLDTTYDDFLTFQISVVSEAIEGYCSRVFSVTTYTQTFYREDMIQTSRVLDTLNLFQFPLISITSVKEINEVTLEETLLTSADYKFNKPTAWLIRLVGNNFFRYGTKIEVEYSAGYSVIPFVIQNATYSIVQERYNKKINGIDLNFGSDVQSISIPGTISIAYDYSLQNNDRRTAFGNILGNYVNTLDFYRSERSLLGDLRLHYVD